MSILETTEEPDTGRYNPELEQLAERHHPTEEPLVYQNSSKWTSIGTFYKQY